MKLEPKARPVQINKLRLGGKDINSIDDLLKNFCLSEILELGDKFTQWLGRHEETKVYKEKVSSIFRKKYTKAEDQGKDLLALFFPKYKGLSLQTILNVWQKNEKNSKMFAGVLNCISPDVQLAINLMQKNFPDKSWLTEWLKSCAKIYHHSDFCYEYGVFLKTIDAQESEVWLKKAKDMGNKKAEEELNARKVLKIKVGNHIISMVRVHSDEEDFYIAQNTISEKLFLSLGCVSNYSFGHTNKAYRKRHVCNQALKKLNSLTKYIWDYPQYAQWEHAFKQKKIQLSPLSKSDGEWCRECRSLSEYRVACYTTEWLENRDYSCLRPVIEVSKNPELQ